MQPPIVWSAPPAELTLPANEICIWKASLDREAGFVRNLAETLSSDERERAARFRFACDRDRFIVGRGLLRQMLGAYLKSPPAGLQFRYAPRGKPTLEKGNWSSTICFNVSHAKGFALYAFAHGRQLGIDLECIRADFDVEEIAQKYFSESERKELSALPTESKAEAFFLGWTRKEAYIKACGEGLHMDLKSFDVTLTPSRTARFAGGVECRWQLNTFFAAEGWPAAAVYEGAPCFFQFFSYPDVFGSPIETVCA